MWLKHLTRGFVTALTDPSKVVCFWIRPLGDSIVLLMQFRYCSDNSTKFQRPVVLVIVEFYEQKPGVGNSLYLCNLLNCIKRMIMLPTPVGGSYPKSTRLATGRYERNTIGDSELWAQVSVSVWAMASGHCHRPGSVTVWELESVLASGAINQRKVPHWPCSPCRLRRSWPSSFRLRHAISPRAA